MEAEKKSYSIGELARRFEIRTSALRYYEEAGLLTPSARVNGHRRYDAGSESRLSLIRLAQNAGFRLSEIRVLLDGSSEWRALTHTKIDEVDEKIAELRAMKKLLAAGLECDCRRVETCEQIASARQ